ncbi:hypothetical protein O3682_11610, partial [Neisseria sp. 27098_8_112]|uniref:hypothetical protein n=1 Tax=Neisseria sp. 27098_8_112 TaxID=3003682 RepID=UPI00352D7605
AFLASSVCFESPPPPEPELLPGCCGVGAGCADSVPPPLEPHALNAMLQAIANILNLNDSFMVKLLNVIMVFWNDGDKIFDNYLHQTN